MFDEHNFRLRMECHKLLMLLSNVRHCKYLVHNQISVQWLFGKKVRLGVSNIHCFWFRFPWMQDDLDAPAAPVNEEPTEQNVDTSQAVQVWNNIHRILCHQWLFIQTADILDIENICWLISLCVGPRPTRVTSTRTFSTGLLSGTQWFYIFVITMYHLHDHSKKFEIILWLMINRRKSLVLVLKWTNQERFVTNDMYEIDEVATFSPGFEACTQYAEHQQGQPGEKNQTAKKVLLFVFKLET